MITHQDHLEIANLVARYCITTDNADVDGFMGCWVSPDEYGGYDSGAFGNMKTWEDLKTFEQHHVGPGGMANGKRHQVSNLLIEPVSSTVVHVTHDLVVLEVAAEPRVIATGRYNGSVVVKTPQGWRFKSRTLHVDTGFFALMERIKKETASAAG
jgi:SnoaL-like domain